MSLSTCLYQHVSINLSLSTCLYQHVPINLSLSTCLYQLVSINMSLSTCLYQLVSNYQLVSINVAGAALGGCLDAVDAEAALRGRRGTTVVAGRLGRR